MSIVLNEREWAENAIASRQLGRSPMETLSRVARYYYQCEGYRRKEVKQKVADFLLQCDPGVILVKWEDTIDRLARTAGKYKLIELDGVDVTEEELRIIASLDGKQAQRLAFTLLCVAKYWNEAQPNNNGWVNTSDKDVMNMANIKTSVRRQRMLLHEMKKAGLISFSKRVDSLNIQVKFIRPDSPVKIHIEDFRNIGNQYLLYCGEPFIKCDLCGLTIKKKNNRQKYCPDCAAEMYIRKSVESVMGNRCGQRRQADKTAAV